MTHSGQQSAGLPMATEVYEDLDAQLHVEGSTLLVRVYVPDIKSQVSC